MPCLQRHLQRRQARQVEGARVSARAWAHQGAQGSGQSGGQQAV